MTVVIHNVKHCYAIRLKFGDKLLTSLIKLELLEAKAKICSTIKENLLLYCKFSAFFVVVII